MPIRRPTLPRFAGQTCCPLSITPFINQATSDVPYASLDKPLVTVLYYIDGAYTVGVTTAIELQGSPINNIHIDHGGLATGLIKIQ